MVQRSVVAVYGLKSGQTRPTRLGAGSLIHPQLALVKEALSNKLAGQNPPTVLRVGVGSNGDHPSVEVIEVSQTLRSIPTDQGRLWALELAEPSDAPLDSFNLGSLFRSASASDDGDVTARTEFARLRIVSDDAQKLADPSARATAAASASKRIFCYLWPNASFCP